MSPGALQIENLNHFYDGKHVLRDIAFSVKESECFALVGMNGAGKTSLLKCVLDFIHFKSGNIQIFGLNNKINQSRHVLSFLPERFIPPYYLNGRDFLSYFLNLSQSPLIESELLAMLKALDLDASIMKKTVRQYSKGMTQKLGLAGCFLSRKNLLILDEPMSGLDPKARFLVKNQFLRLREEGKTVFFNSHSLADVEELSDRMAILHEGEIRFLGSPKECIFRFKASNLEQAYLKCIA